MSQFGFDKVLSNLKSAEYKALSRIAEKSRDYFVRSFQLQGFGSEKWLEVQRRIPGTIAYATATADDRKRPILHGRTGDLLQATENSIQSVTAKRAVLYNKMDYAAVQNEGDGSRHLPARPFMKQNQELTDIQLEILQEETGKIWQVR